MKAVFIRGKQYKKELLIPRKDVSQLQDVLKMLTKGQVLVLNTNLGVEVYYSSSSDCSKKVINSFLKLTLGINKNRKDFLIDSTSCNTELINRTSVVFNRLLSMPLVFTGYSRSTCHQLKHSFTNNSKIITELFVIWQDVLQQQQKKVYNSKTKEFLEHLQLFYLEKACHSSLKDLIKIAISKVRYN